MYGPTNDVAFLLGAGASIPSGYPSTDELTENILSGKGFYRHTDSCYYQDDKIINYTEDVYVSANVRVLNELKKLADDSLKYSRGTESNYEDLLYLLKQISDHYLGEIENPAIDLFIKQIEPIIDSCMDEIDNNRISRREKMVAETEHYIRDAVASLLKKKPKKIEHLKNVFDPYLSRSQRCFVATLNHDTHLETYLRQSASFLADGFGCETNGVRYYLRSPNPIDDFGIQIFKLHGSVDWYTFCPDNGTPYENRVGISVNGDQYHTKDSCGRRQWPDSGRPIVIMGTFNKFFDYHSSLFTDLHAAWRLSLERVNRLVIIGYGFGDKGINSQIIEWVFNRRGRRILLIEPNVSELKKRARGVITKNWNNWEEAGVLQILEKGMESCSSEEILDFSS